MASVLISTEAEVEIARLFADLGNYQEPTVPVLMVHWAPRTVESRRGEHGESVWQEVEGAHWSADVAGWTDTPKRKIAENTLLVKGFRVLLDAKAEKTPGTLRINAVAQGLVVQWEPS